MSKGGAAKCTRVIMPNDCYISEKGRLKGAVVRKNSMGVEIPASFGEYRYVFEHHDFEQAYRLHTCDTVLVDSTEPYPVRVSYVPKKQNFKVVSLK